MERTSCHLYETRVPCVPLCKYIHLNKFVHELRSHKSRCSRLCEASQLSRDQKRGSRFLGPKESKGPEGGRDGDWGMKGSRQTDRWSIGWGKRCTVWLDHDSSESIKLTLAPPQPSLSISEHLVQGVTAGALLCIPFPECEHQEVRLLVLLFTCLSTEVLKD